MMHHRSGGCCGRHCGVVALQGLDKRQWGVMAAAVECLMGQAAAEWRAASPAAPAAAALLRVAAPPGRRRRGVLRPIRCHPWWTAWWWSGCAHHGPSQAAAGACRGGVGGQVLLVACYDPRLQQRLPSQIFTYIPGLEYVLVKLLWVPSVWDGGERS